MQDAFLDEVDTINLNEDIDRLTRECGFEVVSSEDVTSKTKMWPMWMAILFNKELEELLVVLDHPQSENPVAE